MELTQSEGLMNSLRYGRKKDQIVNDNNKLDNNKYYQQNKRNLNVNERSSNTLTLSSSPNSSHNL